LNLPEILAPAGSFDALIAAVRCGADAVYLGGKILNARRSAGNFDDDELKAAVNYCHARGVKLYLTLNTLISDSELSTAVNIVEYACEIGVDALIVQDLGLVRLISAMAPSMSLHASTQMSVQTPHGIKLLKEAGLSRIVLPRELSGEEIEKIGESCDVELEMFVHGAMCMSVSGQCYMSAFLGSRSGNRGLCAQPCRLPFGVKGGSGHDLSLKDLSLISHLNDKKLRHICSLKIEGRMKRPEYVAAAVTACRKALEGDLSPVILEDLKSVFSRSGFTDGYFVCALGKGMFGTRQQSEVKASASVIKSLARLYEKEPQTVEVDFALSCVKNEPLSLTAKSGGKSVFVKSEVFPQPARNRSVTKEALALQLQKCGGTAFLPHCIEIELDENLSIPVSAVNALRRDALACLSEKLSEIMPIPFTRIDFSELNEHRAGIKKIYARFSDISQIPEVTEGIDKIIVPLFSGDEELSDLAQCGFDIIVQLPRGIFGSYDRIATQIRKVKKAGISACSVGTLDGLRLAKNEGMRVHADFGTNIFNSHALEYFASQGVSDALVSVELTLKQAALLRGSIPRGLIAYGRIPLMLTRNCPAKNGMTCAECRGKSFLTDRMNVSFPLTCTNGCTEVLNSRPIYMADRLNEIINMDFITLYFTTEDKTECDRIISCYKNKAAPQGDFTRGNYFRGVE
jgi:putative protease